MEMVRCTSRPLHGYYKRPPVLQIAPKQHRISCRSASYNREFELQKLGNLLSEEPTNINVILGPRSCGKTALLRNYLKDRQKVIYVNSREMSINTAEAFMTAVLGVLLPKTPQDVQLEAQTILRDMLLASGVFTSLKIYGQEMPVTRILGSEDVQMSIPLLAKALMDDIQRPEPALSVNEVYNALSEVLDVWNTSLSSTDGCEWPVLVIDDANTLLKWRDEHSTDLDDLLSFLVQISKESQRCHVLLATSEYGFQAWLNNAIGAKFWRPIVIGDFTEEQARKFFEYKLERSREQRQKQVGNDATWPVLDDIAWRKVYEMCGGNAGDLVRASAEIAGTVDWDAALEQLWRVERGRVRTLAMGRKGAWTAAQFAEVAVKPLDSRYHALPWQDVVCMLGRHVVTSPNQAEQSTAGELVLQQLVKADVLSCRPFSDWAHDVPRGAFSDADVVVTASSTMTLYCMSKLRKDLETILQTTENHGP